MSEKPKSKMSPKDYFDVGSCNSLSQVKRICKQKGIPVEEAETFFRECEEKWKDDDGAVKAQREGQARVVKP